MLKIKMESVMKRRIVVMMIALFATVLFSQTTGVIRGVVLDEMGDPLPGANIVVVGTTWGAETDEDGYYYIIGVRAGTYTLRAQFIGFMPREIQDVRVRVGLTTTQNFKMSTEVMELAEIGVEVAMEKKVEMDVTTSVRAVDMGNVETMAVNEVDDLLKQTAGIQSDADGELHFRGGRAGEVNYLIDGVSVGDPTGAKSNPVEINFANIESFNIQKGIPDAEYGDALSGSVNIVMKIGDQERTSGHVKYATDSFFGDSKLNYDRGEFSLSGPIPLPMSGMKPTYFIATDFSLQDGYTRSYRELGEPDGEYFDFKDYDLTGFGFEIPQRRQNNFNFILRTAYDISMTQKLSLSYTKSRTNNYGFSHQYRYSPESAPLATEDVTIFSLNWRHTINQQSYYDLIFSYYNRERESMPGGKRPDEFVLENDLDQFLLSFDIIPNGERDGGDAEGYVDVNMNGYFDREFYDDNSGSGKYDPQNGDLFTPYDRDYDHNMNGVWDGDILYDSNANGEWDYWEIGQSFSGFNSDVYSDHIVEGYIDNNMNGSYDDQFLYFASGDEPFTDGDIFNDTGEPFVDQRRFYNEGNTIIEYANGMWDEGGTLSLITKKSIDGVLTDITVTYPDFWNRIDHIKENSFYKATVKANADSSLLTITYPKEFFLDLRSSLGSETQTTPRLNDVYNGPDGRFDEFEAFSLWRPLGLMGDESQLGWTTGHDPENGASEYVEFVGTYTVYRAPVAMYENVPNWTEIEYDPIYSTWEDNNENGVFDPPNDEYDPGEHFVDYNYNGEWNLNDGFVIPGHYTDDMNYDLFDNTVMKLKGSYTNQISRYHMLKTGFEFAYNDLDYYRIFNPYFFWDPVQYGYLEDDPYPTRGNEKTQYRYKPKEFSAFLQDKMEFEDLVVNAGIRLDMRILDQDAVDYYEERYNSTGSDKFGYEEELDDIKTAISPRLGISHSISETSKLFFSYGHLYQLPNYTQIFDPNTKVERNALFGNMNLDYTRNVSYELGVVNEIGEYLVDVTGYFKDIYDMLNTKTYEYGVTEATIYYNSDYGKSRGVEISVDKSLSDHYLWGISYTLSYAYGKSSSETSNLEEDVYEVKEFPLDWDERHAMNSYFTLVYGKGETLFDLPYTDDWTLSLSTDFGSGKPFTPTPDYFDGRVLERDIETNSERMPWTSNTDLKFTKTFAFSGENNVSYGRLKLEFNVYNLFNKINVLDVYTDSGKWNARSPYYYERDGRIVAGTENLIDIWKNPANIAERRHFRFGITYQW